MRSISSATNEACALNWLGVVFVRKSYISKAAGAANSAENQERVPPTLPIFGYNLVRCNKGPVAMVQFSMIIRNVRNILCLCTYLPKRILLSITIFLVCSSAYAQEKPIVIGALLDDYLIMNSVADQAKGPFVDIMDLVMKKIKKTSIIKIAPDQDTLLQMIEEGTVDIGITGIPNVSLQNDLLVYTLPYYSTSLAHLLVHETFLQKIMLFF